MPIVINLTTAEHGGTTPLCGTDGHSCGPDCACGCPYTGMEERGRVELIAEIERRHAGEWLALVIPPGEDEYVPEQAMLVVHSSNEDEVFDAVARITHNQVVHVYFNGLLGEYMQLVEEWSHGEE